jgi:hypothetical protein
MMNKFKSKLLTKWFVEWVATECDYETLEASRMLIEQKQEFLQPRVRVIGFKQPETFVN